MYLKRVEISNIRSITQLKWSLLGRDPAGWHVILGNNGSGKSTLLRCIAAAVVGQKGHYRLGLDFNHWLKKGRETGRIDVSLSQDMGCDKWSGKGNTSPVDLEASVQFDANPEHQVAVTLKGESLERTIWGGGKGWFMSSFGPYRRFGQSGNNGEAEQIFSANPQLARHLTIFSEDIILKDVLSWLKELEFRRLKGDASCNLLLENIKSFINQVDFLPYETRLEEITPDEVVFRDGNGVCIDINSLSDGFRSMLSLVFELIRQLIHSYEVTSVFNANEPGVVNAPGVVLIDEIDVHLHPIWQKRIGQWLCSRFPNIQFLVTTHSPLACHAAERGSVFKLPEQGQNETGRFLSEDELHRLLYGNVLEAYGSGAFGEVRTRSERGVQLLNELAQLNMHEFRGGLSEPEKHRQNELSAMFPMGTGC